MPPSSGSIARTMHAKMLLTSCGLPVSLLYTTQAQATLIDRGKGLVYDTATNHSWTRDTALSGLDTWAGQTEGAAQPPDLHISGANIGSLRVVVEPGRRHE